MEIPYKENQNLCEALWKSVIQVTEERKSLPARRVGVLLMYMEDILGEPILVKTRQERFTWARAMVAYQLLKEGYSTTETGRVMGKDHSTIIYLRDRMEDVFEYPTLYKDVIELWLTFQKRIQDETDKGTTQHSFPMGGTSPDCGQQEMVKESGKICPPGDMGDLYQGNRGQAEI